MPKRTYTLANVKELGEHLAKLPPKPREQKTENLGAADLVRTIRKEIRAAMSRGYTMGDIVSAAKSMGFDLSTPTLKKYLQATAGKKAEKKGSQKAPVPDTASGTTPLQPTEKPGSSSKRIVIDPTEKL